MTRNVGLIAVGVILAIGLIVITFSGYTNGDRYEIEPEITLPAYQNDLGRIIDSYERIMDRLIYINGKSNDKMVADFEELNKELTSIDRKLTILTAKVTKIEKALGVELSEPPTEPTSQTIVDPNNNTLNPQNKSEGN